LDILDTNDYFKVEIPVDSGAVAIITTTSNDPYNRTKMTVNLKDYGYILRVKGVYYTMTFDAGLVQDSLGNSIEKYDTPKTDNGTIFLNSGVNAPFIRIEKKKESLFVPPPSSSAADDKVLMAAVTVDVDTYEVKEDYDGGYAVPPQTNTLNARQPMTARVKIDCQTPNTDIYYTSTPTKTDPFAGPFNMGDNPVPSVSMPAASGTLYGDESDPLWDKDDKTLKVGDANNLKGYLYGIRAEAGPKNYLNPTSPKPELASEAAYERAARSVIIFTGRIRNWGNWTSYTNQSNPATNLWRQAKLLEPTKNSGLNLWIRGGDDLSGSSTPGFPLSWDDKDYGGIRLFTSTNTAAESDTGGTISRETDTGSNLGTMYWVSWEVTTRAYFFFYAGIGTTDLTDMKNGPWKWAALKNTWALRYEEYPLHPGASLVLYANAEVGTNNEGNPVMINGPLTETQVEHPATDYVEFYYPWNGARLPYTLP
jgi:hypothetical protein